MNHTNRGFTLIEVLIVVGIMGMLMLISYPSIMNSLETRGLENTARDIQSSMQVAKFQAVKTRINHRIRFSNTTGPWFFAIERQAPDGTWATMHGSIPKSISGKFTLTLNLPAALPAQDRDLLRHGNDLGFRHDPEQHRPGERQAEARPATRPADYHRLRGRLPPVPEVHERVRS